VPDHDLLLRGRQGREEKERSQGEEDWK